MFRKLISFLITFSLFMTSAQASISNDLKLAFDELNYALTVEWDQNDQEFYSEQMNQFKKKVNDLQARGLSNVELIEFVKQEVKNEKTARDFEAAFNIIQMNQMGPDEASNYMIDVMKKSYHRGASWNGPVVLAIGILVISAAAAITFGVLFSGSNNPDPEPGCQQIFVCGNTAKSCHWECQ